MRDSRSIRIAHFVARMRPGGVESWLMRVLRRIDRKRFQFDFIVHTDQPETYDEEILSLGARIIPCLGPRNPIRYSLRLKEIFSQYGPYDVAHSHMHHYCGAILGTARRCGIPIRIAHSHTESLRMGGRTSIPRRIYEALMERWINENATLGLAVSDKAAAALFGQGWNRDPRFRVFSCGIDVDRFLEPADRNELHVELGIPANRFVVAHVGSFSPIKNHAFLIDVAAAACRISDNLHFLLIGDGPLRKEIENKVAAAGISGHVTFAGIRHDVSRLLQGAANAFLFTSFREGLPLALLEAQAAGLPCLCSDTVTRSAGIVSPLMTWLSLSLPPISWAEQLVDAATHPRAVSPPEALAKMEASDFNISKGVLALEELYSGHGVR